MIYDLKSEYQAQNAKEYLANLITAKAVIELKRKDTSRTIPQNSYLHLLLGWYASEYGTSIEEVKVDIYKRACNREIYEREKTNKNGQIVKYLRSSRELTKEEMTTSIERFRNYAADVAGIYLPAPDEKAFLLHIRQEIERNKEYL